MPRKARHTDLQRNIIDFCRVLRDREMLVTPSEVIDAIRTADAVDISDRQEFKTALRSVLTARPEDIPVHDATFDEFWRSRLPERVEDRGEEGLASEDPEAQGDDAAGRAAPAPGPRPARPRPPPRAPPRPPPTQPTRTTPNNTDSASDVP